MTRRACCEGVCRKGLCPFGSPVVLTPFQPCPLVRTSSDWCVYYVRACILERRRAAARWLGVKGVCLATLTLCVMEDQSRVTCIMTS